MQFVVRDGTRPSLILAEDRTTFRFAGFNVPNLHIVEDGPNGTWLIPTDWEIEDAIKTVKHVGGEAAAIRLYAPRIGPPGCNDADIRHLILPDRYNEKLFRVYDKILQLATVHQVRLIIPFVEAGDTEKWGGAGTFERFLGLEHGHFYSNAQCIDLFRQFVSYFLTRINSYTNTRYADHPCILAWQSGNELNYNKSRVPATWTIPLAQLCKALAPRQLFCDGSTDGEGGFGWEPEIITSEHVDILTTHLYTDLNRPALANLLSMAHPKPLFVGEFGFHSASTIRTFLDACVDLPLAGFLIWSLRFRCEKGGFYSHHEFDRWYALHHPGFSERIEEGFGKDERELCRALEQAAGRLTKRTPILPIPEPPLLFPPEHQKGQVSLRWRGSTFASCYDLERNKSGSWKQIGPGLLRAKSVEDNVDMAHGGVTWIDKPGKGRAGYRLRASNDSGKSAWSNEVFLDL